MFYLVINAIVRRRQLTLVSFRIGSGCCRLILFGYAAECHQVQALFAASWSEFDFCTDMETVGVCLLGRWFTWSRPTVAGPFSNARTRGIINLHDGKKGSPWKRQS
jgi:hypothetical protein